MSYFSGHKSVLLFCISVALKPLLCSSFHLLYFPPLNIWMDIYIISSSMLKLLMIHFWAHYSQLLEDQCLLIPISEFLAALFLRFMLLSPWISHNFFSNLIWILFWMPDYIYENIQRSFHLPGFLQFSFYLSD